MRLATKQVSATRVVRSLLLALIQFAVLQVLAIQAGPATAQEKDTTLRTPSDQPVKKFEGTWVMDMAKSVNLPPSFQNVNYYQMIVRIAGDTLVVNASLKAEKQEIAFPEFVYITNGKETRRVDSLRGSDRTSTAKWSDDRRMLTINSTVRLTIAGGLTTTTLQKDVWTLPTPTSLQIATTQQKEGSDSVRTETRIYARAKQ